MCCYSMRVMLLDERDEQVLVVLEHGGNDGNGNDGDGQWW